MIIRPLKWIGRYLSRLQGNSAYIGKGSILIVVLWSLFFLSALALAVNAYIRSQLDLAAKLKDRAKMHYLAKAGVKRAILEIENDTTDSCDALKDAWSNNEDGFKEIKLGDGMFSIVRRLLPPLAEEAGEPEIRYGLVDEERKININKAPYSVLKNSFEIIGETTSQEAGDIAASIIDWRDEDEEPRENGAESGYYLSFSPGYACKNEDFEVLEELLLVKGMTQEIFNKAKDSITVYGEGAVNINTTDELILRSLGMGESLVEKIIYFRNGSDGEEATSDDNVFETVEAIAETLGSAEGLSREEISQLKGVLGAGLLSVRSDNFRGQSLGQMRNTDKSAQITFVFDRNKVIKYWREE